VGPAVHPAGEASVTEAREDGGEPADTDPAAAPLLRSTAVMSVGTALSRITGLLRLSAIGYAIGAAHSQIADAYNVANNTPNIVYELVLGGILTSVFVPVFVQWLQEHGRGEAWEVARSVMTIAVVALSAIAVLTILLAPWIIDLYTIRLGHGPGADAERTTATFFLRWFMPQIVFYGLGAAATGLLNAHRRFAAPMFAPILNNLIVIATMVTFVAMGKPSSSVAGITGAQKYVLAVGTTLGVVGMTVALWPSLRMLGFRFAWRWNWRSEAVRRIGRLASWVLLYVVVNQLGLVVVIVLGTGAENYSAYFNAFILFQLPHAIFAVSIMTALLPALSAHWAKGETAEFRALLARGIRLTALIVIPAALGYIALAGPIVRLLLQHGATDAADAAAVAGVLRFFAIGLFSFSAFQLLIRAFYAMQDSRTPALVNVAAVGLNTAVNFLFFHLLGVKGLALGHATAYTFGAIVLVLLIRSRLGGLDGRSIVPGLGKVLVAGAATAGAAFAVSKFLGSAVGTATLLEQSVQVLGSVGVGLLVFVAMALLLRMEDLRRVIAMVAGRFRR
jgi:putative peptidoglycan lipid II flippase